MALSLLLLIVAVVNCQIKHNLPEGVELVDPKSLGFDASQLDLGSLLGNAQLTPINSQIDPTTGLKTQVLTVGFDPSENLNLDDFELPSQPNSNNSALVQNAFNSFKEYFKNNNNNNITKPTTPQTPQTIQRRRKVKKPATPPKVVELESDQIEKLLATGKLKSRKVGDSQVIEITQEQLNDLYGGVGGSEFRQLLGGPTVSSTSSTTENVVLRHENVATTTTTTTQKSIPIETVTRPPIIYQFNTQDLYDNNYYRNQNQNQNQAHSNHGNQIKSHIKTPTFEFISVPPVSAVSTQGQFKQDSLPLTTSTKIQFPGNSRQNRQIGLHTFYHDDGLNYKNLNSEKEIGI